MLINVKVITNARKNAIKNDEGIIKVYVNAPPVKGKANKALVKLLAGHFKIKKVDIKIVKGEKSKFKTLEITEVKSRKK